MSHHKVILLLGSNLGETKNNIEQAISYIEKEAGPLVKHSEMMITAPEGFESPHKFCNIALEIKTEKSPIGLLNIVKKIERDMGRVRDSSESGGYEDRIIDIDIVSFNNLKFLCSDLQIPHEKHRNEREFSQKLLSQIT